MLRLVALVFAANLFVSSAATSGFAAEHASWDAYVKANRYRCPGPFDKLAKARTVTLGTKTYLQTGYRLEVQKPDADDSVTIGVISAIKGATSDTMANLAAALRWFKSSGVEWLVANGDLADDELDLEQIMRALASSNLPVLVLPGNSDSKAAFARVLGALGAPNLVNGVFIRQVVADDVEFWTMPGYYDKQFMHQGAGCTYSREDVEALLAAAQPGRKGPVVLVSHGPPLTSNPAGIDFTAEKKNVGDPDLAYLTEQAAIPFGIFGHILEAGGLAVGKGFAAAVAPSAPSPALYLNAGSISAEPWTMNDGTTSSGLAIVLTLTNGHASYVVRSFKSSGP
jgi:Icc-related predicted phosphoesterase